MDDLNQVKINNLDEPAILSTTSNLLSSELRFEQVDGMTFLPQEPYTQQYMLSQRSKNFHSRVNTSRQITQELSELISQFK